jgi:membrane protein
MSTTSLLFYGVFAVLPDVRLHWRDVSLAAISTAILFTLGNTLIGLYLGSTGGSAYGAVGSAAVILLWAYASSIILFFGAELSWATVNAAAEATGQPVRLSPGATWIATPQMKASPRHLD